MKTFIADITKQKDYEKILLSADKDTTLLFLYREGEDQISLQMYSLFSSAKCKLEFKQLLGKDTSEQLLYLGFLCGYIYGIGSEYILLSDFDTGINVSILPSPKTTSKTRTTRNSKKTPAESVKESEQSPVAEKTRRKRTPKVASITPIEDEIAKSNTSIIEKEIEKSMNAPVDSADDEFDKQFDMLMDILNHCNNGTINPAGYLKQIVEAIKLSETEKQPLKKSLTVFCNSATAVSLSSAINQSAEAKIRDIVKNMKDEM